MLSGIKLLEILDAFLKEKKISRRQFCIAMDMPVSTVASWKSKNILPPLEVVVKIAKFMNVSLDWLVYGDELKNEKQPIGRMPKECFETAQKITLLNTDDRKMINRMIDILIKDIA